MLDILKEKLKKKYVNLKKVNDVNELEKNQDTYLLGADNFIIGLHLKNVDLSDISDDILGIKSLRYLFLKNVNFKSFKSLNFSCINLQSLDLSENRLKEFPKEIQELKNLQSLNLSGNGLKEFPKELFKLTELKSLDISRNGLKKLPNELFELTKLQSLDICWNKLEELPKKLFKLKGLHSLNISDNSLQELPKELFELRELHSLNISGNSLQELPKELSELKELKNLNISNIGLSKLPRELYPLQNIQSLDISSNSFEVLPKFLFALKNLRDLNLSYLGLEELPNELQNLKKLQSLNLSSNSFYELPIVLLMLKKLKSLIISDSIISELPRDLFNLKNLETLKLAWCGLNKLPKELFELQKLKELDLSYNKCNQLPKEIIKLKNLESLSLTGNVITELPNELFELKELKNLSLDDNNLLKFPQYIVKLKNLQSLSISNNRFKELPNELFELKELQSLDIASNQFEKLPQEIKELKNLQRLDLTRNVLKEFPKEIVKLSRLSSLQFADWISFEGNNNKIKTIPDSFINFKVLSFFRIEEEYLEIAYKNAYKEGLSSLQNFIQQMVTQNRDNLYEAKLLFVGESGAGKTSMMEKVLDKNYTLKTDKDDHSTIGIDIKKYSFPYIKNDEISFRTNMWDFGGQQIQHMSHQFFLTPNSLYVLVGNDRKQDTDFDYWFHIINLLSNDSPIFVLLNQINHNSVTNFDYQAYKKRFNTHIIEEEKIDLSDMTNGKYEIVKSKIESMLCELPHIGDEVPAKWVDIRKDIDDISQKEFYITFEKFETICKSYGLSDRDIDTVSKHFHNIGIFLHYNDDIVLSDIIFLNPKWLMDGIYSVLSDTYVKDNYGKFSKKWLYTFWEEHDHKYPKKIKDKLLSLMLKDKFEICYRLDNGEESYLSPQLLPSISIAYDWDYDDNLFYRFQYPFMPKGIISRLIVRLNEFILKDESKELVWQKGVFLEYEDAKAFVVEEKTKEGLKVIDISIQGNKIDKLELLSKIKHEIEYIHKKSFENIPYEEMIPCYCDECGKEEKPEYYDFKTLKNLIHKKIFEKQCNKSGEMIFIPQLLGNVMDMNQKSKELKILKEMGIVLNINNHNNSSASVENHVSQTQNVEINISQSISGVVSSLSSLKRKVDDEDKEDVEELISEFESLGENPSKDEIIKSGLMSDLEDLVSDFDETMQDTEKVINKSSKAIKTAKSLGRSYNELASLCGLPNIPFFLVNEEK